MNNKIAEVGDFVRYNGYIGTYNLYWRIECYMRNCLIIGEFYEILGIDLNIGIDLNNRYGHSWYCIRDPEIFASTWIPCNSFDVDNKQYLIFKYGLK